MDSEIQLLADKLASFNPKSMQGLKEIMWEGTDHWDELLIKRAEISGERVLSEFTRKTIEKLPRPCLATARMWIISDPIAINFHFLVSTIRIPSVSVLGSAF